MMCVTVRRLLGCGVPSRLRVAASPLIAARTARMLLMFSVRIVRWREWIIFLGWRVPMVSGSVIEPVGMFSTGSVRVMSAASHSGSLAIYLSPSAG